MIETFPKNSLFIRLDQRQKRWAIPYNYHCLNSRVENLIVNNSIAIKDKHILDLGCHLGTFAYASLIHGAKSIYGIDSEEKLILQANKLFKDYRVSKEQYDFYCDDIIAVLEQLKDKSYDTILCLGVFYYINDPVNLLRLMKKVARKYIIIDTFTAYYAAIVSKDGSQIAKYTSTDTFNLPIVFYPLVQAKKKDYAIKTSFNKKPNKPLSILSLPTITAIENFYNLLSLKYSLLSWKDYSINNYNWQDFIDPSIKINSHWADVYHTKIRVSYLLEV